ncbi:MAG: sugar phosphate nucleotidyltransferase [Pseudomonadota bacterium]
MQGLIAAVLAGGRGKRLGHLTIETPKPLVPYAGTCRMIDFSLDNCRKSGLRETVLMAKHLEKPLVDYLNGQWASHLNLNFGHSLPDGNPVIDEKGTADALINNRPFLDQNWTRDILVLHSDHIYNFDYRAMYAHHLDRGAALTIGYQRIPREFVSLFGMTEFDEAGNLRAFVEKPKNPTSDCVFTAVAIFKKDTVYRYLTDLSAGAWKHDISFDLIPAMLEGGEAIVGFPFEDYWEDIGTLDRYHSAHMRLCDDNSHLRAPLTLAGAGDVVQRDKDRVIIPRSLADADFTAHRTCLFPGALIGSGAHLENTVVLPGGLVSEGEQLSHVLISAAGRTQIETPHG